MIISPGAGEVEVATNKRCIILVTRVTYQTIRYYYYIYLDLLDRFRIRNQGRQQLVQLPPQDPFR
jgi:hypothetical protein